MKRFRGWLHGWKVTLQIVIFRRDLYRQLRLPLDEHDFGEVPRPGGDGE